MLDTDKDQSQPCPQGAAYLHINQAIEWYLSSVGSMLKAREA